MGDTLRTGDGTRAGDRAEQRGPLGGDALVRVVVDVKEAEARPEALGPLEVVVEAPVIVPAYVEAFRPCQGYLLERSHDVLRATRADLGGDARLADDHRQIGPARPEVAQD